MKKLLKSLFGGSDAEAGAEEKASGTDGAPAAGDVPAASKEPAANEAPAPAETSAGSGSDLSIEEITRDLVAHILTTMPDPRPAEEIDHHVHMFDAGYVTSISAADLLAHIEATYGLDISETKLIGPLQNLHALASFIQSPTP